MASHVVITVYDAITYDIHLYACNNLRMTGRIFMQFGMDVITPDL
jgi:hypothetical protein